MNMELDNFACPEYEARLEDYLSGQLSGAEAREVSEHLRTCPLCSSALAAAQAGARLLRLADATGDAGPGFARTVMARIRMEREAAVGSRGFWQPFVSLAWRFAATAGFALVAMLTYDVARHMQTPEPTVASARSTEIHDLFTTEADRVPMNGDEVLLMVAETNHGKH